MVAQGHEQRSSAGRCLVLHPALRRAPGARDENARPPEARLAEAVGLARAIALDVVHEEVVRLSRWRPSTLIGSGAVESLATRIAAETVAVVVVDATVS